MLLRLVSLFSCALLAACASEDTPRYRDTAALEKPPTLVFERQATLDKAEAEKLPEDTASVSAEDSKNAAESSDEDQEDSGPETPKGLGDQVVSISDTPPRVLTVRQSFDVAWNSLKQSLVQSRIEVTDLEHDKGKFYVSYDADSFISEHGSFMEKSLGLLSNDYAKQGYLLTLTAVGSVTKVTAAPLNEAEYRKRTDHDDEEPATDSDAAAGDKLTDGADQLLRSVYLTLKDDLVEN